MLLRIGPTRPPVQFAHRLPAPSGAVSHGAKRNSLFHTMQMLLPFSRILGSSTFPSAGSLPPRQSDVSMSDLQRTLEARTFPSHSPAPCLCLLE